MNKLEDFEYTKELIILKNSLIKNGDELRLVGGCVRNFLMKKEIFDYDLCTTYKPNEVLNLLNKSKIKSIPTGIKHGTITAIINKKTFEITTLRNDFNTDGRHADVNFITDYFQDAKRRDLTINAIYLDFENNLYDYFNGIEDIKNKNIKFIGNPEDRIQEDFLRILRFFRFYSHYGNKLDKDGLNACIKYKNYIKNLSKERIKSEFFKILKGEKNIETLEIIENNKILNEIILINKVDFNLLKIANNFKINDEILLLFLIINDKKYDINSLKNSLKLSNKEFKKLDFLQKNYNYFEKNLSNNDIEKLLFFEKNKENIKDLILINSIFLNKNPLEKINFLDKTIIKELPITAKDLIERGYKGKEISLKLKELENIFIDKNFEITRKKLLEIL